MMPNVYMYDGTTMFTFPVQPYPQIGHIFSFYSIVFSQLEEFPIESLFINLAKLLWYRYVKPPIFTLCVGNAWGEAALLLAAGAKGNRSALPSSTIMIRQVCSQPFLTVTSFGLRKISCFHFLYLLFTLIPVFKMLESHLNCGHL